MMRAVVFLCIVLLPGVMLTPAWSLAGLGAGEDDVLYYYPMRAWLGETWAAGEWPWLNPLTGLGRPYVADPQTAVWYPGTWLFLFLPPLTAYPLSLWLHYSLALWGMYRLLRAQGLDARAALFGELVFAFGGFMLAHRAHFVMQHAAAWTPWVFWGLRRYAGRATAVRARVGEDAATGTAPPRRSAAAGYADLRRLVAAAFLVALQCLSGHVQIAALTVVGALVFLLATPSRAPGLGPQLMARGAMVMRVLLALVCAAGVFAIQWLPTFAYMRVCTRVERTYADFVENSWHPLAAVGWVWPMLLGQRTPNLFSYEWWGPSHQVEQFAYAGLAPLLLAILALAAGWRADGRRWAWSATGLVGLLLALGQYGPICPLLYSIPGSSLFRCPARALLLVNLAIAALAAVALHELVTTAGSRRSRLRAVADGWFAQPWLPGVILLVGTSVYLLANLPFLTPAMRGAALLTLRPSNAALWMPLAMLVLSSAALTLLARAARRPGTAWVVIGVAALDLGVIGWHLDVPPQRVSPEQLVTPSAPAEWMEMVAESPHRLWVVNMRTGPYPDGKPGEYVQPVEKAVANTNLLRGIATLTDYGPLQPRSYHARFGLSPWGEVEPPERALELLADTAWMRLYNVGWVLLTDERLPAPAECDLAAVTPQGWRLFRSPLAAGPVLVEPPDQPAALRIVRQRADEIRVACDTWPAKAREGQPAEDAPRLVLSNVLLPGWTAHAGEREVALEAADGVLTAVALQAGQPAEVTFRYFPPGVRTGAAITLVSVGVLTAAGLSALRRRGAK